MQITRIENDAPATEVETYCADIKVTRAEVASLRLGMRALQKELEAELQACHDAVERDGIRRALTRCNKMLEMMKDVLW